MRARRGRWWMLGVIFLGRHADEVRCRPHQYGPEQDLVPGSWGRLTSQSAKAEEPMAATRGETGEGQIVSQRDGQVERRACR